MCFMRIILQIYHLYWFFDYCLVFDYSPEWEVHLYLAFVYVCLSPSLLICMSVNLRAFVCVKVKKQEKKKKVYRYNFLSIYHKLCLSISPCDQYCLSV